jgi:arabinan endo-1,5-alpha-L-arabinosidase
MKACSRNLSGLIAVIFFYLASAVFFSAQAAGQELHLRGQLDIHDPSTIVKCDDTFWVFGTGRGIFSKYSTNLVDWRVGPPVFTNLPEWTTNTIAGNRGKFWAPDVIHLGDRYLLYYSISTWGSHNSAIGLAANRDLNPASPNYHWEDLGLVIRSTDSNDFNTIDPSVMRAADGRLWLAFGSFNSGIKVVELDPKTGLRADTNEAVHPLAWKNAIEAACLYQHANYYYLFVNWGLCCRGVNSTYNIRVGRSANVTGPYVDAEGVDLLQGGGTLVTETSGYHFGPGHAGILSEGGTNWFSCHYYSGHEMGRSLLDLRQLNWNTNGWPEVQAWSPD